MENKKNQIEMTNDLCKIHSLQIPMLKGLDIWAPEIAEKLIKLGWVKPDEDSVVILKEDWKENHDLALMSGKKEGSRETAEKIKYFIFSKLNETTDDLTRLILREIYWQVDGFVKTIIQF